MKKTIIYFLLIAVFFLVSCNAEEEVSEKELFILGEIGIDADEFALTSNDVLGQMEAYSLSFVVDGEKYIGFVAFYHGNEHERLYNEDSFLIADYDKMRGDKPFEIYSSSLSVPSKYSDKSDSEEGYTYYYGNINDAKIVRIIIDLEAESQHILAADDSYSTLMNNTIIPKTIKGLDENLEVIYEVSIYE